MSSHLVPLLLQESSHLVPLLLQESSLHFLSFLLELFWFTLLLGFSAGLVPPYVGMARKQNGGYNASISVQTLIVHLVVNSTHPKTVRSSSSPASLAP